MNKIICRLFHKKHWEVYAYLTSSWTDWRRCKKCGKELVTENKKFKYFLDER